MRQFSIIFGSQNDQIKPVITDRFVKPLSYGFVRVLSALYVMNLLVYIVQIPFFTPQFG